MIGLLSEKHGGGPIMPKREGKWCSSVHARNCPLGPPGAVEGEHDAYARSP